MRVVYGTQLGETLSLSLGAYPKLRAQNVSGDPRIESWYVRSSMPRCAHTATSLSLSLSL
jgi:hypothetical protein